jgi:PhnB protein
MRLIPHISYNGECEAALTLYAECLGGEVSLMLRFGESPMAASNADRADKIVHATLKVGDQTLTGADVRPEEYEKPRGFAVQLNLEDPEQAQRVFEALAEGGVVLFPLQKTFWAGAYGMVTDRFGMPWEINCGRKA